MPSDLVLGTAQLGMAYGINRQSVPTSAEAQDIVREAVASGIRWIDTASAYGSAEENVGAALRSVNMHDCRVVTKISPLEAFSEQADPMAVTDAVERSLSGSMSALGVKKLDAVLLHRWSHWSSWGGAVRSLLERRLLDGTILTLGASVQTPGELRVALRTPSICHIQMPINILDDRWEALVPEIVEARQLRKLVVHARSALLQGLILSRDMEKWRRARVEEPYSYLDWVAGAATTFCDGQVVKLCLNWVRALNWIDGVVVGVDSLSQLRTNLQIFSDPPLTEHASRTLEETRQALPDFALNPANWI